MAIGDDFSIAQNGDIRWVSGGNHTVIAFHRWLGDLMDDAQASGNDFLDITSATASERATDNLVTLLPPYNIDAATAQHLYDGSIVQDNGNTIYDGVLVIAPAGTHVEIVQNGALATNFWTTGLNPDAANNISHKFMLLVRTGGADIDGRRFIVQTREFGYAYSEFKINGSARGNNVAALRAALDNVTNTTPEGTVATWTTITNLTEGYKQLDVDNDTVLEPYYSEWNKDTFSINQFFERMKWLTRRGSTSTLYGLNGELFRGITHEVNLSTGTGTWGTPEHEQITWTGGTGRLLAVDNKTGASTTKMWLQLLTGVAPTAAQVITGTTSGATGTQSGAPVERTLSFPFCGQSTGTALLGSYGFALETADLTASDKITDLAAAPHTPPNNVTFSLQGLVAGEDRALVAPLAYVAAYDNEGGTPPFVVDELLTFTSPAGTATLIKLVDNGTTGYLTFRMVSGSVPTDNSTITGGTSGATADIAGVVSPTVDVRQRVLNTSLLGATETAVVLTSAIPTDTPPTGDIRIQLDTGIYREVPYLSYSGSAFTIASTSFTGANAATAPRNVWIAYIDKLAGSSTETFTSVFLSTRDLFVRVRDGDTTPIKTFDTTAQLGSAGGSTTAIRTKDE